MVQIKSNPISSYDAPIFEVFTTPTYGIGPTSVLHDRSMQLKSTHNKQTHNAIKVPREAKKPFVDRLDCKWMGVCLKGVKAGGLQSKV